MPTLPSHRRSLGMSQRHAAFLLGTAQPNISAYESGAATPGPLVASRLEAFLALTLDTAHRGTWAGTLPSHAAALAAVAEGAADRDLTVIRHVVAMHDAFTRLTSTEDRAFFLTEPSGTGSTHLDSLLAGLAVHWTRVGGLHRVPLWTRQSRTFLGTAWFLGTRDTQHVARARAVANGIPALRARGIYLDRATLASV